MAEKRHYVRDYDGGAECSCGRDFNVWTSRRSSGWSAANDFYRTQNLIRAGARRHANAANARIERTRKATADMLRDRYHGAIEPTDAMIDAVLDGLAAGGK